MIAVGGFYPASKNPSFDSVFPISASLPTLHIMGRGDVVVPPERSLSLVEKCENARVEYHDGGESARYQDLRSSRTLCSGCDAIIVVWWETAALAEARIGHFTPSKASWRHFFK